MATKSGQEQGVSTENIEEMLDVIDKNLERIKTLYEQYFLGIQKQAPTFLHTDIERKLRDLTQLQIRNTGMRYRLATLQQKFGAYNSYWKRTLRQIENGTYLRNLSKIGREAIRTGAEIPEEILAAMPKRMREQVIRDRDQALQIANRRNARNDDTHNEENELLELADGAPQPPEADEVAAMINEPSFVKKELKTRGGAHIIADDDFDLDKFFSEVEQENTETGPPPTAPSAKPARASTDVGLVPPPPAPVAQPAVAPRPSSPASAPIPAPRFAPSQASRPNPIAPGSAAAKGDVPVESMQGPFPRAPGPEPRQTGPIPQIQRPTGQIPAIPPQRPTGQIPVIPPQRATGPNPVVPPQRPTGPMPPVRQTGPVPTIPAQPAPRPAPPAAQAPQTPINPRPAPRPQTPVPVAAQKPPPGMSDADVNALYQKYAQAKQLVGEQAGARDREKLLKTINAQAPKIMEQYKAKGVEFSVVVKDNQVIIRAKPKT